MAMLLAERDVKEASRSRRFDGGSSSLIVPSLLLTSGAAVSHTHTAATIRSHNLLSAALYEATTAASMLNISDVHVAHEPEAQPHPSTHSDYAVYPNQYFETSVLSLKPKIDRL